MFFNININIEYSCYWEYFDIFGKIENKSKID